jgi:hypothetical protein
MSWRDFLSVYSETLGVALGFSVAGAGFTLWLGDKRFPITKGQAVGTLFAAMMVACIATAFVHGYMGWSIFLSPFVGFVCGLIALPIIRTIIKGGQRVETRADDIADKGINMLPGGDK